MSLSLISNAYAAETAPDPFGGGQLLFLVGMVAVFYFLVLRPQQVRAKEQKIMLDALQKGDEVVALGGALGRVVKVGESYVSVEVTDGVTINVQKSAIQTVLPKGTIKSI